MIKKQHSERFKSEVALAAIKEEKTIAEIAGQFSVHPTQVKAWKRQALEALPSLFGKGAHTNDSEEIISRLERKVGQLALENDFLKKSWQKYQGASGR
jgi:transposase-like protein